MFYGRPWLWRTALAWQTPGRSRRSSQPRRSGSARNTRQTFYIISKSKFREIFRGNPSARQKFRPALRLGALGTFARWPLGATRNAVEHCAVHNASKALGARRRVSCSLSHARRRALVTAPALAPAVGQFTQHCRTMSRPGRHIGIVARAATTVQRCNWPPNHNASDPCQGHKNQRQAAQANKRAYPPASTRTRVHAPSHVAVAPPRWPRLHGVALPIVANVRAAKCRLPPDPNFFKFFVPEP